MSKGRPSKYKPEYAEQVETLCKLGATDVELAEFFKVSMQTIYNWKKDYPDFLEASKRAKEKADREVEKSLYRLATGYEHKVEKPIVVSDGKDLGSHVEVTEYTERLAPNATAIIYWLKNRQPQKWRDKHEHELTGKDGEAVKMQVEFVEKEKEDA